jgi:hypothetical protein
MCDEPTPYRPMMSDEYAKALRRWHDAAYDEMRQRGEMGDIDDLARLIEREGFLPETVAAGVLAKDNLTVTYTTQRLTR